MTIASGSSTPVVADLARPLRQRRAEGDLLLLESELLADAGFRHAFSTRTGGVSGGPFASLNLGVAGAPGEPDSGANLAENRRRLACSIGAESCPWVLSRQVHGREVHWSEGAMNDPKDLASLPAADAIATATPGRLASVRTADCVPILLACPRRGAVAAVHAGWRGLVLGVIDAAVDRLVAAGAGRGGLLAAIGPAIGVDAYEVGEDVVDAFRSAGREGSFRRDSRGLRLDLLETTRRQLLRMGLASTRIDGASCCTHADASRFFSYRRDGARSGRLAAVIEAR